MFREMAVLIRSTIAALFLAIASAMAYGVAPPLSLRILSSSCFVRPMDAILTPMMSSNMPGLREIIAQG